MSDSFRIRTARHEDLPAILAIFNDLIATSTAVYTETLVDLAERTAWLEARQAAGFPVLVVEEMPLQAGSSGASGVAGALGVEGGLQGAQVLADGRALSASRPVVLGYASFGSFRGSWPGYRHTVEHSVHVRADQRGRGLGTALIHALFAEAQARDVHVMVGAIDAENTGVNAD